MWTGVLYCLLWPMATLLASEPNQISTLTQFETHQIQPLVTPGDMRAFMLALEFPADQQDVASIRYEEYIQSLETVVEELTEREQAIQNRLNGILAGRYRSAPEEVKALRIDLEQTKSNNWPPVDEALDSLIADIQSIGIPVSPETNDRAVFELYRRIYLRPMRREAADNAYAGEGLDFFEMTAAASNAELADADPLQLDSILQNWRQAMIGKVREDSEASRKDALEARIARLSGDREAQIAIMMKRSQRWSIRKQLDYTTFVEIYGLCPTAEAAAAWTSRYRKENYPWLWKDNDEVERIADWIMINGDRTQIETVQDVVPGYLAQRDELRLEAEDILRGGRGIGANLCENIAGGYEPAQDLLQRLMQNSGKRAVLMRQARAELEQPLSDGQRAAIRRLLLGTDQGAVTRG